MHATGGGGPAARSRPNNQTGPEAAETNTDLLNSLLDNPRACTTDADQADPANTPASTETSTQTDRQTRGI